MTENLIEAYLKTKSECDTLEAQIRTAIGELSMVIERLDVEKGGWKRLVFSGGGIAYPANTTQLPGNSIDLSRLSSIRKIAEWTARWQTLRSCAQDTWNQIPSDLRSNLAEPPI